MTEEQLIKKIAQIFDHDAWHLDLKDVHARGQLMTRRAKSIVKAREMLAVVRESEGWQPIDTAPKDGEIEVRGDAGPYGISSWTGLAHWGLPTNWHRDNATWLSHAGAVLRLAGYYPREWRPIPPPPKTEGED